MIADEDEHEPKAGWPDLIGTALAVGLSLLIGWVAANLVSK